MKELIINTEKNQLNIQLITDFIAQTYWAKGRTLQQVQKTIANSLNFGVYLEGRQIGYARVVTDFTTIAYLMDVFIIESERGKGYSKKLMEYILSHPELKQVENWKLNTKDAHGLYQQFGFKEVQNPKKMMERELKNSTSQ
ncbi:GNAT family N-acetyltransferase [Mesonia maritima]|uniref:N-acetylglutamate synthase-like GNAT family acetyltransferase n=1 Tax=Mesonia maritima TaxID=1793873 RepID=A0ABU1K5V0_9FLAO|nr:GNAT family N-acetyltransferase [Mesonia maritima]MDR6300969.1 N-acetylglutamate synthase-like GNAT family acetyltransferase [Mesonia maritima]